MSSAGELGKARVTLQELEALPVDEIRRRLEGGSTPLTELRAVASLLGIRPVKKLSRDALSHQIAMKIANYRGYQQLRIGTDADAAHLQTTRADE